MDSVGLRELRHFASEAIRRVEAGEEIEITVQGRPSARIVPLDRAGAKPAGTADAAARPDDELT